MNTQNRIYVTLSPRVRAALKLCATHDGSTPAAYAASLLSSALLQEIEKSTALRESWIDLERKALQKGTWSYPSINETDELNETASEKES